MIPYFRHRCCGLNLTRSAALTAVQLSHRSFTSTAVALPNVRTSDPAASVGRLAFDASKAGLARVDKAHVERVMRAATKGTAFYKSEQRKEAERTRRHKGLVEKQRAFRLLPLSERQSWAAKSDAVEADLESTRDFTRSFIHIDMDMFYAAVEEKFNPSLRDRPFAVGSFAMLATSNYIARQYGVRSGMPGFIAKKLCPSLWIQPLHFDLYRAEAASVRAIAATYDPGYVTVGLDELTMDVTEYLRRHNNGSARMSAEDVCAEFRARVEAATQLTCSGGVSHTAAFSKLASNVHKPNGQHVIKLSTREEVLHYVRDTPVRDIPGVGSATEGQLKALGILTCKDFLAQKAELCYLFREKTFAFYLSAGLGLVRTHVDRAIAERAAQVSQAESVGMTLLRRKASPMAVQKSRSVACPRASVPPAALPLLQKSTGKSITVSRGLPSEQAFRARLRQLVKGAHDVLVQQSACTRHISFTTIDHSFKKRLYSTTLPNQTANFSRLYNAAAALAEPFVLRHREFRLIGVNFGKLQRISVSSSVSSSKPRRATKAIKLQRTATPRLHRSLTSRKALKPSTPSSSLKSRRSATKSSAAPLKAKKRDKNPPGRLAKARRSTRQAKHRVSYVRHV
ncbi:putative DNA polymerase kappa [Leptomonas seymouri]|uniref:DNA polymerase kappa n=1 Tax=Leptomonas seymouri TaxID=5684 RepID=A0A0N1PDB9_LEPSE|nr:putative DNA polymerase kappa [Leptomonas seymouri]|eukprot:KPI88833.1 putative DNA polymerase kappa [Leptomonas seymouri]